MQTFAHDTFLQEEVMAYPDGDEVRYGKALVYGSDPPRLIDVWAGIPDTYFSIPAHTIHEEREIHGWVGVDDGLVKCSTCNSPRGAGTWTTCTNPDCMYGLVDSPTRGALVFHPQKEPNG